MSDTPTDLQEALKLAGASPDTVLPEAPPVAEQYDKSRHPVKPPERSRMFAGEEFVQAMEAGEKRREEAVHARYEWHGREVRWTLRRDALWYRLRTALGFPRLQDVLRRPEVLASLNDAVLVIFLGLHEPEDWEGCPAHPDLFHAAILTWAEVGVWLNPTRPRTHGITREAAASASPMISMSERKEACALFDRIFEDSMACLPEPAKGSGEKAAPGN
jgi:hypothetical protein